MNSHHIPTTFDCSDLFTVLDRTNMEQIRTALVSIGCSTEEFKARLIELQGHLHAMSPAVPNATNYCKIGQI